jgi:polysaccharide export outer membrane protein
MTSRQKHRKHLCGMTIPKLLASLFTICISMVAYGQEVATSGSIDENQAFTSAHGIPEYRIGAGDELRIQIWTGIEARQYTVTVQADGSVFLPFVGLADLQAGERSPLELRDQIVARLSGSYRNPAAEVIVEKLVARMVTLLGEIRTTLRVDSGPGRYALPGRIRLVDFITQHGGVTSQADLNRTQLMREGKSFVYNLSDAVFRSDLTQNPVLDDGDLVYVPPLSTSSRRFLMFGELGTPGLLELPTEVRIAEAVARAGGLTPDAHRSRLVVVRGGLERPTVLASDFKALENGDLSQNFMLEDGDMVFVSRRALTNFKDIMTAFAAPLSVLYTSLLISNAAQ